MGKSKKIKVAAYALESIARVKRGWNGILENSHVKIVDNLKRKYRGEYCVKVITTNHTKGKARYMATKYLEPLKGTCKVKND